MVRVRVRAAIHRAQRGDRAAGGRDANEKVSR